jgi:selenocysteine lyase/cysteine desulfurase
MIYLDNSATSFPKAPGTADSVSRYLTESGVNASRASYRSSTQASLLLYNTRKSIKKLFKAKDSDNIIFTSGTTHSINIVINSCVIKAFKSGKKAHFITSSMEHNAVMRPLKHWADLGMCTYSVFRCGLDGMPDLNDFEDLLKNSMTKGNKPDLAVFTACSNVTGTVFPVKELACLAHEHNIPCCIDAAQAAGKSLRPVSDTAADYVCFSGHKGLLGPFGIGGLILNPSCEAAQKPLVPLMTGGTGSFSDSIDHPDFLPDALEAGTLNLSGIAGLETSVNWLLENSSMPNHEISSKLSINGESNRLLIHEKALSSSLVSKIRKEDLNVDIHSPVDTPRIWDGTLSISFRHISLSDAVNAFDQADIAVRMGLHCAPMAHMTIQTFDSGGTIRISPGPFNTEEDINAAFECIRKICLQTKGI